MAKRIKVGIGGTIGRTTGIMAKERRWRTERHDKTKGGGVLLDLGIHAIDNAWFMMGCPQPLEVSAGLYCAFADFAPADQIYTADDAASGFIRFENGCTLNFVVAFS